MIQSEGSDVAALSSDRDEEALARLEFLIRQPCGCGVIAGPAGCGKSELLRRYHGRVRRTPATSCLFDATGLDDIELAWELCAALGLGGATGESPRILQRRLRAHLVGMRESGRRVVLLVDNADRMEPSGRSMLVRIIDEAEGQSGLTVIWTGRTPFAPALREDLVPRTLLRIDREPLTQAETEAYVHHEHPAASAGRARFEADALQLLQDRTNGAPRSINRLCRLAGLAAEADGQTNVSVDVIQAAADELP